MSYLSKGEDFVADSTGKNIEKMARWIADAQMVGYKVHVCYVRVKLSTALHRNANRERVVPAEVIIEAAGMVERSSETLKAMVDSHEVVDND